MASTTISFCRGAVPHAFGGPFIVVMLHFVFFDAVRPVYQGEAGLPHFSFDEFRIRIGEVTYREDPYAVKKLFGASSHHQNVFHGEGPSHFLVIFTIDDGLRVRLL